MSQVREGSYSKFENQYTLYYIAATGIVLMTEPVKELVTQNPGKKDTNCTFIIKQLCKFGMQHEN